MFNFIGVRIFFNQNTLFNIQSNLYFFFHFLIDFVVKAALVIIIVKVNSINN